MTGSTKTPRRIPDGEYFPAVLSTVTWFGIGAALDVGLIVKNKNRLITDVFRTPAGFATLLIFNLHVLNILGPFDPFRGAAKVTGTFLNRLGLFSQDAIDALIELAENPQD